MGEYPGLFIGEGWTPVDETIPIINPATECIVAHAPVGNVTNAAQAIAAARRAFDHGDWRSIPASKRQAILQRFHNVLMSQANEICKLIVAEAGATQASARTVHFGTAMRHAQFFIDICTRDPVTSLPIEIIQRHQSSILGAGVTIREPIGVVSAITPYNFPFFLNVSKVFPALAVGNCVILKPSPLTPLQALLLGHAAIEAELPPGVLNIITGDVDASVLLTSDPQVDLVSFTGSDLVGAAIQSQAAPSIKRVLLELGGKSALIVRADANLEAAAASGLAGFTVHAGQGCALLTRHLVHNSVRPQYVEILAQMLDRFKIGDPADGSVTMGPLINAAARGRTEHYVTKALDDGARLVRGGKRPENLKKGFFYEPTLFDDVQNNWKIAQEEVFGPVGVVIGYDDDDEAISLANDSPFGLHGGIFSANVGRAYEMALELRTGGVSINGGSGQMSSHAPFGGIKRSGYGREYGLEGLNEYTYIKSIGFHGG